MFYAANIPLLNNDGCQPDRITRFAAGLALHAQHDRRPHFLFGSRELKHNHPYSCLAPMQNSFFEKYHPEKGALSVASDMEHIAALVEEIKPYMKSVVEGYVGEKNANGDFHGKGVYTYASGASYEGEQLFALCW